MPQPRRPAYGLVAWARLSQVRRAFAPVPTRVVGLARALPRGSVNVRGSPMPEATRAGDFYFLSACSPKARGGSGNRPLVESLSRCHALFLVFGPTARRGTLILPTRAGRTPAVRATPVAGLSSDLWRALATPSDSLRAGASGCSRCRLAKGPATRPTHEHKGTAKPHAGFACSSLPADATDEARQSIQAEFIICSRTQPRKAELSPSARASAHEFAKRLTTVRRF
jgi:hypothetical protein